MLIFIQISTYSIAQFNENLEANFGDADALTRRDDQIWSSEAANVVYKKAGNISILSDSRFGMSDRWEISSNLGTDYWVPNLTMKRLFRVKNKIHYWSFKIKLSTGISGYNFAQKHKYDKIISQDDKIPYVLAGYNELIYSHAFRNDPNCAKDNIWLILTGSLTVDIGLNLKDGTVGQAGYHFLANRSAVLNDWGAYFRAKVWADWLVNSWLVARGGIKYFIGTFNKHHAVELQAEAEAFITSKFSCKLGGLFSVANYTTTKHKTEIYPLVDISYYFGKRKNDRDNKLFDANMLKKLRKHGK